MNTVHSRSKQIERQKSDKKTKHLILTSTNLDKNPKQGVLTTIPTRNSKNLLDMGNNTSVSSIKEPIWRADIDKNKMLR